MRDLRCDDADAAGVVVIYVVVSGRVEYFLFESSKVDRREETEVEVERIVEERG